MRALLMVATFTVATSLVASAEVPERRSDLADQQSVGVTIYNSDLALVHDRRHMNLTRGENKIAMRDVSANIDAATALFRSITAPNAVSVREQNFDFDLLTPEDLLNKYVGQRVTVIHRAPVTGVEHAETATVLSTNNGVVLQYANRIETQVDGRITFPSLPANLRDRPTLVLDLDSTIDKTQDVELSYLTGGLSWRADYIGELDADDKKLDLTGLITLTNASGTSYRNARVQLVAGDVNVVRDAMAAPAAMKSLDTYSIGRVSSRPTQQSIGEFHLYTLANPTTLGDKQTKQVALLDAHAVPVTTSLELRGYASYYGNASPDLGTRLPVGSYLSFTNKNGDLGVPLPKGVIRIYKHDRAGTSQFIGSDSIDHTPKNEEVRIFLGNSFDVTAHKKQTEFQRRDPSAPHTNAFASTYEIELKNAKSTSATVLVVEPIPGDWTVTSESFPHKTSSSRTASWTITVPAGGSQTLRYSVLAQY